MLADPSWSCQVARLRSRLDATMQPRSGNVLHARLNYVAAPAALDGIAFGVQVCDTGIE